MQFVIGTANSDKVKATQVVLDALLQDAVVKGVEVSSGVSESPWNEETKQGAFNRADKLLTLFPTTDYTIGLEAGLSERFDDVFEEVWCCLKSKTKTVYGYSSGLKVPDYITSRMKQEKLKHYEVMRLLRKELGQPNDRDTWGNYSHKMLVRSVGFEEALRNALVQIFAPSDSLYHK